MNDKSYRWVLYVIVFVILGTIAIQVYWNYKNYLTNKQQLINDVQLSLDNAVESYYAHIAENNTIAFAFASDSINLLNHDKLDSLMHKIEIKGEHKRSMDSIEIELIEGVSVYSRTDKDSVMFTMGEPLLQNTKTIIRSNFKDLHRDSTSQSHFRTLTSKVILSMTNDSLRLKDIDSLFQEDLSRKKLNISYGFTFQRLDEEMIFFNPGLVKLATLRVSSSSPLLSHQGALTVHFSNETKIILKRILTGILISTLLVLVVISCLFYLLKIIKHQKQLAEVKNDLISNITHEFKTPIATIGVALESIKDFKVIDDKEKTKKYLNMSVEQLNKLNVMVEKLLETATLDSDSLELIKEKCNVTDLLNKLVEKHQMLPIVIGTENKTINFTSSSKDLYANIDAFYFENALNNVLDNAIKYGGNEIVVEIKQDSKTLKLSFSDNGNELTKVYKDKIFEQFYRVPKGNTHNIKGFGIGLYYTKKIIEKHGGSIRLDLNKNLTCFKIIVPNE